MSAGRRGEAVTVGLRESDSVEVRKSETPKVTNFIACAYWFYFVHYWSLPVKGAQFWPPD